MQRRVDSEKVQPGGECVACNKAVKRVAREAQVVGTLNRLRDVVDLDLNVVVFGQPLDNLPARFPESTDLEQHLKLQHRERRKTKPFAIEEPLYGAQPFTLASSEPARNVCIEVNHKTGFQCVDQSM